MNDEMPLPIAHALRSSRYYFSTQLGEIVPLLCILGVRTITRRRPNEKTDLIVGTRKTDYYETLPEGCIAVKVAGRGRGRFPGELILQPGEVAAFVAAIRRLEV